jgi:hypothetical protein
MQSAMVLHWAFPCVRLFAAAVRSASGPARGDKAWVRDFREVRRLACGELVEAEV